MIDKFDGEYAFLSNFYDSPFEIDGIVFPTVEHYFQAMKTTDVDTQREIAAAPTPGKAKRMGRQVSLRPDWEKIKEDVMWKGLKHKFQDSELREKLLATGYENLVEGNWWKDTTWGICNGVGENKLGKLLMSIRDLIRKGDL